MNRRMKLAQLCALIAAGLALVPLPATAQTTSEPQTYTACYMRGTGLVYRIRAPGLPSACVGGANLMFSWTDDYGAVRTGTPAGGDLSGTYPDPTVAKLQGTAVTARAPTAGQVLTYNADSLRWVPATPTGTGAPSGPAGGDLAGTYPNPTVARLNGLLTTSDGFAVGGFISSGTIPASGPNPRLMWYPGKGAFRAGNPMGAAWDDANIGVYSTAMGVQTTASGFGSTAIGDNSTASGIYATALGISTASGIGATAVGNSVASGPNSTAMGQSSATAIGASAMGSNSLASGQGSTAMGASQATGEVSTAMGEATVASGYGSVAMGSSTTASGDRSTAVGDFASTNGQLGSFVYGDASTGATHALVTATVPNQFVVRAAGGTVFYSSADLSSGVALAPGAGAWATVSSRARKHLFRDENGEAALGRIVALPIQSWSYRSQDSTVRHLGPTAQDFRAAFGLGESDTTITTTDIEGVALLAAQALEARTRNLQAQLEAKDRQIADLKQRLERLEAVLGGR